MVNERLLFLFLLTAIGGALLEKFYLRFYGRIFHKKLIKKHHFLFSRYLSLLLMPTVALTLLFIGNPLSIGAIFLLFAFLGPILEWLVGYAYYSFIGQRLWTYHKYAITGYTSFLTIPFWGIGGVLFYLLAKLVK